MMRQRSMGPTAFQRFFYVTLPLLRNTLIFIVVYTIIGSMKFFDLIYVTTAGGRTRAARWLASTCTICSCAAARSTMRRR